MSLLVEFPRRRSPRSCARPAPRRVRSMASASTSGRTRLWVWLARAVAARLPSVAPSRPLPCAGRVLFRGRTLPMDPARGRPAAQPADGFPESVFLAQSALHGGQTIGEALRFHRIVADAEVPAEIERLALVGWRRRWRRGAARAQRRPVPARWPGPRAQRASVHAGA